MRPHCSSNGCTSQWSRRGASDGASRGQGGDGERKASTGSVLYGEDQVSIAAAHGRYLGDSSNNVAEYVALRDALAHACRRLNMPSGPSRFVFRVDSMLVSQQVNCRWRCLSIDLLMYYEESLQFLQRLKETLGRDNAILEHVYREYNADADGICNNVLDLVALMQAKPETHTVVIQNNW